MGVYSRPQLLCECATDTGSEWAYVRIHIEALEVNQPAGLFGGDIYASATSQTRKKRVWKEQKGMDGDRVLSLLIIYANLLHCSVVQMSRVSHPDSAPTWTEMGCLKVGIALSTEYLVGYAHIERMLVGIANSRSALFSPGSLFLFFLSLS